LVVGDDMGGRNFFEIVRESIDETLCPYLVSVYNDGEEGGMDAADIQVSRSELADFLPEIIREIREKIALQPLGRKGFQASPESVRHIPLNTLVVGHRDNGILKTTETELEKMDLPVERIRAYSSAEGVLDILSAEKEELQRCNLLMIDVTDGNETDGETLIDFANDLPQRPFIVMIGSAEIPEALKGKIDLFFPKTEKFDFSAELPQIFYEAQKFAAGELYDAAAAEDVLHDSQVSDQPSDGDLVIAATKPSRREDSERLIITPEDDVWCWYEQLAEMPDLRKPVKSNGSENADSPVYGKLSSGNRVAMFDVDGTLAQPFVMGRFVRELSRSGAYANLIKSVSETDRHRNQAAFGELLNLIQQLEDGTYKGPYEELIRQMNKSYSTMLSGMEVRDVFRIGNAFASRDVKRELYWFSKPVLRLIHYLGLTPTFVTGMPAEALAGYRHHFEIEDRCYPLQLHTQRNSDGKLIYDYRDKPLDHGGLAENKEYTASQINANGNEIYMHMGDQESDIPAMHAAIKPQDNAFGKGFYVMNINSITGQRHIEDILRGHSEVYNRGHLMIIDKNWKVFTVLLQIVRGLHTTQAFRDDHLGLKEGDYSDFRIKLNRLLNHPAELRQFYKFDK